MNKKMYNLMMPAFYLFTILTVTIYILKKFIESQGISFSFLLAANALLFLLSIGGLFLQGRHVKAANTNAFIRGVYSSLIFKMFTVIAAVLIYIAIAGGSLEKAGIFIAMGIYILYTSIEVYQLMKLVRKKTNE